MQLRMRRMRFGEFGVNDLYKAIQLRGAVLVDEAQHAHQDLDDNDQNANALHLLYFIEVNQSKEGSSAISDQLLIAYARLLCDETGKYKIDRFVVAKDHRNKGIEKELRSQIKSIMTQEKKSDLPSSPSLTSSAGILSELIASKSSSSVEPSSKNTVHEEIKLGEKGKPFVVNLPVKPKTKEIFSDKTADLSDAKLSSKEKTSPDQAENKFIFWWQYFKYLSLIQCYRILQLRLDNYSRIQKYAFLDPDDFDQHALHLICVQPRDTLKFEECQYNVNEFVACARVILPEFNHDKLEIGRVMVRDDRQGEGIGAEVVRQITHVHDALFPHRDAYLTFTRDKFSQNSDGTNRLETMYAKHGGFIKIGKSTEPKYDPDSYDLWEMKRQAKEPLSTSDAKNPNSSLQTSTQHTINKEEAKKFTSARSAFFKWRHKAHKKHLAKLEEHSKLAFSLKSN